MMLSHKEPLTCLQDRHKSKQLVSRMIYRGFEKGRDKSYTGPWRREGLIPPGVVEGWEEGGLTEEVKLDFEN